MRWICSYLQTMIKERQLQYIVPGNDSHKITIKIYIFARNTSFNENLAWKSVKWPLLKIQILLTTEK